MLMEVTAPRPSGRGFSRSFAETGNCADSANSAYRDSDIEPAGLLSLRKSGHWRIVYGVDYAGAELPAVHIRYFHAGGHIM